MYQSGLSCQPRLARPFVKQELTKGISLTPEILRKIDQIWQYIFSKRDNPELVWYGREDNLIFKLKSEPKFIFKISKDKGQTTSQRFRNMKIAKEICLIHHLDLLKIPSATTFKICNQKVIVEEFLEFDSNLRVQKRLYESLSGLRDTIDQLVLFIREIGFAGTYLENIPILDTEESFTGSRRIALVDLEYCQKFSEKLTYFVNQGARDGIRRLFKYCIKPSEQETTSPEKPSSEAEFIYSSALEIGIYNHFQINKDGYFEQKQTLSDWVWYYSS